MPRRRLSALRAALCAVLLTGLLAACSSEPLPEGGQLLSDSAAAMREVTSMRAALEVDGTLPGVPIKSAEGVLTRDGSAEGSVSVDWGNHPLVLTFVIIGEDLYLKGATGGFQKLGADSLPYDPSMILDADRGVAHLLAGADTAETQSREDAAGVDSYRVEVRFPREAVGDLVPGYDPDEDSQVWIASADRRLVQAELPTTEGTLTFRLSDFDAPTTIRPPI